LFVVVIVGRITRQTLIVGLAWIFVEIISTTSTSGASARGNIRCMAIEVWNMTARVIGSESRTGRRRFTEGILLLEKKVLYRLD
jgi:hypothetical protein